MKFLVYRPLAQYIASLVLFMKLRRETGRSAPPLTTYVVNRRELRDENGVCPTLTLLLGRKDCLLGGSGRAPTTVSRWAGIGKREKVCAPKVSEIPQMVRIHWDFAMWHGDAPLQRSPMELVTVKGATNRGKKPRSLAVEEFPVLLRELDEPFRSLAVPCLCFEPRISECALKWSDVDWLNGTLSIECGVVHQVVDDVKMPESERLMHVDPEVLSVLKSWKLQTQFSEPEDWMFASPAQIGRLQFSYAGVWRAFRKAAAKAGLRHLSSHCFRHTFRSWLDVVGTPLGVQKRLMRHTDIVGVRCRNPLHRSMYATRTE